MSGLSGTLILKNGNDQKTIVTEGPYTFETPVPTGSEYAVMVLSAPLSQACTVANSSGTVQGAEVTNVDVSCGSTATTAIQGWAAPSAWGGVWQDDPDMVQHAHFDGTGIVEDKGITWTVANGTLPAPQQFSGLPSGPRFEAGPFDGPRYQATSGDGALDVAQDMLVCAVVKPDYNPSVPDGDGLETVIIAKGVEDQPASAGQPAVTGTGWVLRQMHDMFCFFYKSTGTPWKMVYTPTYFADRNMRSTGPLNPSYVVVCAGRDGNTVRNSANGDSSGAFLATVSGPLEAATAHRATIGGFDTDDPRHKFLGRVLETAVWRIPATPENIRAKYSAFAGLGLPDGTLARYTRNREGPYDFTGAQLDGRYHTTWRHGPRVDPARGMLFGLQGWNRLSYADPSLNCAFTTQGCSVPNSPNNLTVGQMNPTVVTGEDLSGVDWKGAPLWAISTGASAVRDTGVTPPGDSGQAWADHVTLAPGASLSRALDKFDAQGPIHAMMWVRPGTAAGTLTVRTTQPDPTLGTSEAGIELGALPAGWSRVWLKGLTTDGSPTTPATIFLENRSATATIDFYAWGLDLTQIGGGGDLGTFDPGVAMYDWAAGDDNTALVRPSHNRYPVDVLELPAVPKSTAGTGFCLSAVAQPPDSMPWDVPLASDRVIASWVSDVSSGPSAKLFMEGTRSRGTAPRRLCFSVTGVGTACSAPSSWSGGPGHTLMGCVSAGGDLALYVDGTSAATARGSAPPDLGTGHVLVGNGAAPASYASSAPWHGFVSKIVVCGDSAAAGCH